MVPRDAANLDASPNSESRTGDLTRKFLPCLKLKEVVEKAYKENDRGGGEKISDDVEVAADHISELKGCKKKNGEGNQVGNKDGDTADAGDGSRVEFADLVRLIHQAPVDRKVSAQRRQDERHTEGQDG
jgi:hypothetical protein